MSLLLLFSGSAGGPIGKSLSDSALISVTESEFDTINLYADELSTLDTDSPLLEALGQATVFNQGDTANISIAEGIFASISGTFPQALAETASISVTESIAQFDGQVTLADTASVQVNETIANSSTEPKGPLADTASISVDDNVIVLIGIPITIQIPAADDASIRVLDVISASKREPQQVAQMTFTPLADNITFTAR